MDPRGFLPLAEERFELIRGIVGFRVNWIFC
jgi:hypothetical protein